MGKTAAHQRLADLILKRPVVDFIAEHRANALSWRGIADALRDVTDGAIDVSHEAVRQWHLGAKNDAA